MVKILTICHESYHLVETISCVSQGIDHLNQQYNNLPEVFQVACLPVCHIPFQLKYLKIKLVPEFHIFKWTISEPTLSPGDAKLPHFVSFVESRGS